METSPRHQNSNRHCSNSSTSSNSNGVKALLKPINRSECPNPYPTTFVQADSSSFKQVVQMLTGSTEPASKPASKPTNIRPIKPTFNLYERRNSLNNFRINPLSPVFSLRNHEILSPSVLDFPSLVLSPVTPLIPDPFGKNVNAGLESEEEAKAMREKGFYLHPSPREKEPQLLPLFPVTSPRESGCSSTSS